LADVIELSSSGFVIEGVDVDTDGASGRPSSTPSRPANTDMVIDGEALVVRAVDRHSEKKEFVQVTQLKADCKWVWQLIQVQ
jgi:hypothetical protein